MQRTGIVLYGVKNHSSPCFFDDTGGYYASALQDKKRVETLPILQRATNLSQGMSSTDN